MMRVFVALDLPGTMPGALARLQAGLPVGRAVPEENLHLTLAFLGEVAEGRAEAVAEGLEAVRLPAVALALTGLELFGGRGSSGHGPNLLAVGAGGAGLEALHGKVMRAAREAGAVLPRRRFRPHVTIARLPRVLGPKEERRLRDFVALNGRFALPPEPAGSVSLYRSHLSHEGAQYEALASFALRV